MKDYIKTFLREAMNKNRAAGVLVKCEETNKVLLLLRNDKIPSWSLVSGNMEYGEGSIECLNREIREELSINPKLIKINEVRIEIFKNKNMDFHYCEGLTNKEFIPNLNNENIDWGWFSEDELPTPLYVGMEEKIKSIYDQK